MPVRHDPASATEKWVKNLSASTAQITAGIERVTVAPGMSAAKQKQKWLNGVQNSADKWAKRVGAVSLQDWQQAAISVGVPRVAQGAQAKQGKMQHFMADFLPFLQKQMTKIDAMDTSTQEARIAKAVATMRAVATYQRKS